MEDQLITFETAKLAKEKKSNIPTRNFYADLSWNSKQIYSVSEVGYDEFTDSMEKEHGFGDIVLIPTQSLLQKWLREVYNIKIRLVQRNLKYSDKYWIFIQLELDKEVKFEGNSYEQALEIGLYQALKLIK